MRRKSTIGAVPLVGLLLLPTGAFADDLTAKATCPATITRGATFNATIDFTNHSSEVKNITKYALAQHFGGLSISGPKTNNVTVTVPAASGSGTITPGTASTSISVPTPTSVVTRQVISTGFVFLGTTGSSTLRKPVSDTGCLVEVQ